MNLPSVTVASHRVQKKLNTFSQFMICQLPVYFVKTSAADIRKFAKCKFSPFISSKLIMSPCHRCVD